MSGEGTGRGRARGLRERTREDGAGGGEAPRTISWQNLPLSGIEPYLAQHASLWLPLRTAMSVHVTQSNPGHARKQSRRQGGRTQCVLLRRAHSDSLRERTAFVRGLDGAVEKGGRRAVRIQVDDGEAPAGGRVRRRRPVLVRVQDRTATCENDGGERRTCEDGRCWHAHWAHALVTHMASPAWGTTWAVVSPLWRTFRSMERTALSDRSLAMT